MLFLPNIISLGFDKLRKGFNFERFLIYTITRNTIIYY